MPLEIHGPFTTPFYNFVIDGYKLPHVKGILVDGENTWNVIVDDRFCITVPHDQLQQWLWLMGNAMAVTAGFSHHGKGSHADNRFSTQVFTIGSVETGEADDSGKTFNPFDMYLGDDGEDSALDGDVLDV